MVAALGWGALAASSLVLGAGLAFARRWPTWQIGLVLAFGAGALISAVSFELAAEGLAVGSLGATAGGLAIGALTYYGLDGLIARRFSAGRGRTGRASASDPGIALALGAFLDGIPEQLVLGIGLAGGEGIGIGLLVAIFVSNLPEAIGSASEMRAQGSGGWAIMRIWIAVALICTLASVAGYAIADVASGEVVGAINGFAAGALLVMLVDSMIPDATKMTGRTAGLETTLGFAVAAGLSALS
jgi:ZIP family zinc transporter